ncbi:protein mesh [Aplysia californica]|uniref:alpha-amylase n=1 Tax=Aplysia californica TaxID=6500 RepID=A0ABM1A3S6_APLCA|nr:protein mesh [Aplysia californica]
MDDLSGYLIQAVVNVPSDFSAKMVVIATWVNVTDRLQLSSGCDLTSTCKSSTFQAVVVADDSNTFVIFNYEKMEIPIRQYYQAGVNGGYRRGWTNVVPCQHRCPGDMDYQWLYSAPSLQGADVRGRFLLSVGAELVVRGGCLPGAFRTGQLIEVYPQKIGMFGGEKLEVSGLCSSPGTQVTCRFRPLDNAFTPLVTHGEMRNSMRGYCPVPILTWTGATVVEWSVDGRVSNLSRTITAVLPDRMEKNVQFTRDLYLQWFTRNASSITVEWNPSGLSLDPSAQVNIKLIGYREDEANNRVMYSVLRELGSSRNQAASFTFDVSSHRCTSDCELYEEGLLEVSLLDGQQGLANDRVAVRYGPIPLGWYVNEQLTSVRGPDWSDDKCREWNARDSTQEAWLQDLLPCPCSLDQALADFGRFQADPGCNLFTGSKCFYHKGAKHCVRSIVPVGPDGSGNQCCYNQDGTLRYSQLSYQGSTPDRSHNWGAPPFSLPDRVPSMSHWKHDVITFYYCCLWNEYSLCDLYMEQRPTADCRYYDVPGIGFIRGDPHVTTFDSKSQHFGGQGDYWVVRAPGFDVQGKFESLAVNPGSSALTQLVISAHNTPVIAVWPVPEGAHDGTGQSRGLEVVIDDETQLFTTTSTMWQDFAGGLSVLNNAPTPAENSHNNFTFLFSPANIGVNVLAVNGILHVTVALPPDVKNQTGGLLGKYDGDPTNDFTSPDGQVTPDDASPAEVYQDFFASWAVKRPESLFYQHSPARPIGEYTPYLSYAQIPSDYPGAPQESEILSVCAGDENCKWDFRVTGQRSVAEATRDADALFDYVKSSARKVVNCGLPEVGKMAVLDSYNFSVGLEVRTTGCKYGKTFAGQETYRCTKEQLVDAVRAGRADYGIREVDVNDGEEYITHWVPRPQVACSTPVHRGFHDPHCEGRQVIVHLFEWKWTDVAQECERYLGPMGFCGVQISPPNEHVNEFPKWAWSERYNPVSYKLESRSGTEAQLRDMVQRCNKVGVRIYADAVINHMAALEFAGFGVAGSFYNASARYFPGVPYNSSHFNMANRCPGANSQSPVRHDLTDIRNCGLSPLTDLNHGFEWVRAKVAAYLNSLIDIGVAGFRVDAATYIWPMDLDSILSRLHRVDGGDPFVYHEVKTSRTVMDMSELSKYFPLGLVTEFRYTDAISRAVSNISLLDSLVQADWVPSDDALVFVDNHDTQRSDDGTAFNFKSPNPYTRAVAFTLAYNYGFTRIMSSYYFLYRSQSPPHVGGVTKDVTINADGTCGNGWVCEHRWKAISNMVKFRSAVSGTSVDNWSNTHGVASFSRGDKGFFAMSTYRFRVTVNTGLPAGTYCDLMSDCAQNVTVDATGRALVEPHPTGDYMVAFINQN